MSLYIYTIIILILVYIYISNSDNKYDSKCIEYKIFKEKKENNVSDTYNIKEFDIINDNVIIHNKFKTELLDHNNNKYNKELEEVKLKNKHDQKLKKDIILNSKYIQIEDLNKQDNKIKQEIKFIKNNLKKELNEFLIDYKNKIATKKDALIIISNINKDINETNEYINKIDHTYHKYPLEKIRLLKKKKRLYNNILI